MHSQLNSVDVLEWLANKTYENMYLAAVIPELESRRPGLRVGGVACGID